MREWQLKNASLRLAISPCIQYTAERTLPYTPAMWEAAVRV